MQKLSFKNKMHINSKSNKAIKHEMKIDRYKIANKLNLDAKLQVFLIK